MLDIERAKVIENMRSALATQTLFIASAAIFDSDCLRASIAQSDPKGTLADLSCMRLRRSRASERHLSRMWRATERTEHGTVQQSASFGPSFGDALMVQCGVGNCSVHDNHSAAGRLAAAS